MAPPLGVEPEGRRALVQGAVLAVLVYAIPFARFILSYLQVLIHELGHAAAAWSFGYPSIPAFDFRYGGGLAPHLDRSLPVVLIIYAGLGYVVFAWREHPGPRNLVVGFVVLYSLAAWTPVQEIFRLAMGHGMELIIAGVFVYRAITGSTVAHALERSLYAACGFFIVLANAVFAWGLMTDAEARANYAAAKGGGHIMDLSRLAREYFHVGLPAVAFVLLLGCLATPGLSYLAHRRRRAPRTRP